MDFLPVFPSLPLPWSVAQNLRCCCCGKQICGPLFSSTDHMIHDLRERGNFFKPNWTAAAVQDVSQPFIHSLGTPWWYPVLKSYKKPILRPGGSRREEGDPTSDLDILSQDFASTLPWNNFRCCCLFNNNLKLYVTHLSFFGYEWVWWCVSRVISPHPCFIGLVGGDNFHVP